MEPPQPPATAGQVPKEGDRAAKIYGIGIGIQGLAGAIGLGAYYGSDSDMLLNNVGAWYFLATTAGSGVLTWLYGNGSYYYDVPIWAMYIGSVVGGGLGWLRALGIPLDSTDYRPGLLGLITPEAVNFLSMLGILTVGPIAVVLALFAGELMDFWLGEEFAERSVGVLRVLAAAQRSLENGGTPIEIPQGGTLT